MRKITVMLTVETEEVLNRLMEQSGLNKNRLINVLIKNAVIADVVRQEPVAQVEKKGTERCESIC